MDRLLKRVHHAETSARGGSVSPSRQKTTSDESYVMNCGLMAVVLVDVFWPNSICRFRVRFIAMSDNLEAVLSKYKEYRSNILSNG